ncbi:Uncharacterised protein [[Clostridium] sordellii]|uniref:Uncharacterized protein n=1 Tax=Paraclostridium sordellii TaxID=1505 RepID=A0ABP1XM86_PARSO|nr:hypothetical protein [Paeniclostridium sordellii]CEJ72450.1 hypothetical protein ATCC9714_03381 [[Clostridium] sordellii] [Paeniclostridium sordellii]CEN70676.1 Uncharacterised protein [[Clostridium] sordellii] [Paeniclostridium sordellii]CEN73827.1 Uncharacterised protein [[Clostridium] sordellii] [Paeniclostridium sordellii]CEO28762.1 Uncharacterised protein [[Clostridium] sordellii] [Paeniclostridium sordellii]CEP77116.1 Uncharacterised protein [[Clostridium] sordellii] [Paeniclostridium
MINNINKNSYNVNTYTEIPIKTNDESDTKQNGILEINNKDFLLKLKEELENAQLIAIKIIIEEPITKNEEKFIDKKYPDIKQFAKETKEEFKLLKQQVKDCKTPEERKEVISKVINSIKTMIKKGLLTEVQGKIKLEAIKDVENFAQKVNLEDEKAEVIGVKKLKGERITPKEEKFISEKYPKLKKFINESKKELTQIKEQLKVCKNDDERKQVIKNIIKDIEVSDKKGTLTKPEVKVKLALIKELEKFSKQVNMEDKKIEATIVKVIKGEKLTPKEQIIINEKYTDIKDLIEPLSKEYKSLKEELKNCTNKKQKQEVISKVIKNLEEMNQKNLLSPIALNFNMILMDMIKKENEKNNKLIILNPYVYINPSSIVDNLTGILMVIVIIFIIFYWI